MIENWGTVIAVDIGGTKIAACLVRPGGSIISRIQIPTQGERGGEFVIDRVVELTRSILAAYQDESQERKPIAVGIGTAGLVDPLTGIISFATSALPGWKGIPVRDRLIESTGLPVFVDNDVNAMILGEVSFGAGQGYRHAAGLTVGTGVGGGIVIDGKVYKGAAGFAGEIGHIIIDYKGNKKCPCGRYGCLEAYASSQPILEEFILNVGEKRLIEELKFDQKTMGVKELAGLALKGVPEAIAAVQNAGFILGTGIASIVNLLNPDIVIVGGGVAQTGELYFASIRQAVKERALPTVSETPILPARLGTQANLLGAACLAWQGAAEKGVEGHKGSKYD
jgi:glucokinase